MGTQARKSIGRGIKTGGARRDRTADLLHAMQALSQLSYGPTWRRGTLPGVQQFVKSTVYAPHAASARVNRDNDSALPKMASVASIGGDTVPPHTARRIGCASFPSGMPFAAAKPLMTSCIAGADQFSSRSSSLEASASNESASAVTCLRTAFSSY